MILSISAQQPHLQSLTDDRFGRSPWLIKIDTVTNQWEAFPNPGANQSSGTGVAAAQFVIDQHVDLVISGSFGPHAANAFEVAKIEMQLLVKDISTVQQAIDSCKQNKLLTYY